MAKFINLESSLQKSGFKFVVGIDEAGRGPLAGPVVSASVILKKNAKIPGLNDSKKLTAQKREKLFALIIENSLDYSISFVSHLLIDQINILNASIYAHRLCVQNLKIRPDIALIDGCDRQMLDIPFRCIIKGDSKIRSIAAASILAKVARDRLMKFYHQQFAHYQFDQHMGYGTRLHRQLIKLHGTCEIHRKSYNLST